MPVAVPPGKGTSGYVLLSDITPEPGAAPVDPAPVYGADGDKIGYWGSIVGWLDVAVVEAPGFDLRAAQDEALRSAGVDPNAPRHGTDVDPPLSSAPRGTSPG